MAFSEVLLFVKPKLLVINGQAMGSVPEFYEVYHNGSPGKFRLASTGVGWKITDGDTIVTISASDISYARWTRVARRFQLYLGLKGDKKPQSFENFSREDFDRLSSLFKSEFSLTIETEEISLRGWNWGKAEFKGSNLAFMVAGKTAFNVPIAYVHNTSINKNEVALEFLRPEAGDLLGDSKEPKKKKRSEPDELVEMRLYIPGSVSEARKREIKAKKEVGKDGDVEMADAEGEDEDEEDEEAPGNDEQTAAEAFHEELKEKAELGKVVGEGLVTFSEVQCATPRGRFDIDMFPTFFRLRSKSYDYKILYSSVSRVFMLPKADEINVSFVINLDPPIRQGQTRYPYLVLQFARDEEMECEINADDDTLKEKHPNLSKTYDAPAFEVVSTIFQGLTGKKPIVPSGAFQNHDGQTSVKCNLKASEGYLYLLERYLLFIAKQPLLIPYSDIHVVRFERLSSALTTSRTFDMKIETRSEADHVFSSLSKEEHQPISQFLTDKRIKVKNEMADDMIDPKVAVAAAMMEEDEDETSDEDAERRNTKSKNKSRQDEDEDEDSEVDEDFKMDDEDSDVPEEYDENYQSSGSSDGDAAGDDNDDEASSSEKEAPPKKKAKT